MRLKKYAGVALIIATISLTYIVVDSNNDKITTVDEEIVIQSYSNLMNNNGIEHTITTEKNGFTLDTYRDRENGRERIDYYDEKGLLVNRTFTDNFGKTFIIFSQYINEEGKFDYMLRELKPPKEAVEENKEILQKSIIDGNFTEKFMDETYENWEKHTMNENTVKYSSDSQNVYVNLETNEITKIEMVSSKGEVLKTLDVEIINPNQNNIDDIFKLDSPLIKENAISDIIKAREKSLKLEIEDNTNVEYDSSNAYG